MKSKKLTTLKRFKDKHYGIIGTVKRDKLEAGFENFLIGTLMDKVKTGKTVSKGIILKKLKL